MHGFIALAIAGTGGCLVPGPPQVESTERIPPVIDMAQVQPEPQRILVAEPGVNQQFRVDARSSAADGELYGLLYKFGLSARSTPDQFRGDPSPFDGAGATFIFNYDFREEAASCYRFEFDVTHTDNLRFVEGQLTIDDASDVAVVDWWVSVVDQDGIPASIADCIAVGVEGAP